VETHCPQCGVSLAPKTFMTLGIWMLGLMIAISGTLLVLSSMFVLMFYMNVSSRAELYEGSPYHATTFRVTGVQYMRNVTIEVDGATSSDAAVFATGVVEGRKESMNLWPYLHTFPRNQEELMVWVPEGTVISVYLFPTLRGQNRIQLIEAVPTAEAYQRQVTWVSNRALPVVGLIGVLTALLSLARVLLLRSAKRQLDAADHACI
jgi:hypothetical protein